MKTRALKKTTLLIVVLIFSYFNVRAQTSSAIEQDKEITVYNIENYKIIEVRGEARVFLNKVDDKNIEDNTIRISRPHFHDKLSIFHEEGVFVISTIEEDNNIQKLEPKTEFDRNISKKLINQNNDALEIIISTSKIPTLRLLGTVSLHTIGESINANELSISLSGTSEAFLIKLDVELLHTKLNGASQIYYDGNVRNHHVELADASSMDASRLKTKNTKMYVSGTSRAHIYVENTLEGNVSGMGKIQYYNQKPSVINLTKSGLGILDASSKKPSKPAGASVKNSNKQNRIPSSWSGLEFGTNGWLNSNHKLDMPVGNEFLELNHSRSISFSINYSFQPIHLNKDIFYFTYGGVGIDFNNYAFANNTVLQTHHNVTGVIDSVYSFRKNRLNVIYLTYPLMLEAKVNKVRITGGALLGVRISSVTVQKYNLSGQKHTNKIRDNHNINPFKIDLTASVGYGSISIFAKYGLNSLFKTSKGPVIYPYTIGIRLG